MCNPKGKTVRLIKNWRVLLSIGCVSIGATLIGWRWLYPYGARPCALPCILSAIILYADEHDGWFPKGTADPIEDLSLLVPSSVGPDSIAGISGDRHEAARRFKRGLSLTNGVSSWIYFPGFRADDPKELAIIWDRAVGVGFNGKRAAAGSKAVGFADGSFRTIPANGWAAFEKQEEEMRRRTLSERGTSQSISTNNLTDGDNWTRHANHSAVGAK